VASVVTVVCVETVASRSLSVASLESGGVETVGSVETVGGLGGDGGAY